MGNKICRVFETEYNDAQKSQPYKYPLHKACEQNRPSVAEFLCDNCQLNPNDTNDQNESSFELTIDENLLSVLRNSKTKQSNQAKKILPLHQACEENNQQVVDFLINDCHSELDEIDDNGNTPLIIACKFNSFACIDALLFEGNVAIHSKNKNGESAIDVIDPDYLPLLIKAEFLDNCEKNWEIVLRTMKYVAEGSYSKVYNYQLPSKNFVVIKKCREKINQKDLEKEYREYKNLEKINHPNILKYYYAKNIENYLHLFLEYIDGKTLTDNLPQIKRDPNLIKNIMFQLFDALAHMHSVGIMHRDIKCDNIMLTSNKMVKVVDFGFSKQLENIKTMMHTKCGTELYMAPEIRDSWNDKNWKTRYSYKVDVWSAGIVFFEMIMGGIKKELENKMTPEVLKSELTKCSSRKVTKVELEVFSACVCPKERRKNAIDVRQMEYFA